MSLLRSITGGLRSLFRKEQVSQELHEELNGFLEMAAEEKVRQGMSRKDALRAGNQLCRPVGRTYASPSACCATILASQQPPCWRLLWALESMWESFPC